MNHLKIALSLIAKDLEHAGKQWALIGGLAISAQAEPRFTRDIDLVIAVADDQETESMIRSLLAIGYRIQSVVEQDAVGRLSTIRLLPPGGNAEDVVIDLLFASSGIEPEIVADSELVEIMDGIRVHLARIGHLLALKVLSRDDLKRPQDIADIRALLAAADGEELDRARAAIKLITERGFHRNRTLLIDLESLIAVTD